MRESVNHFMNDPWWQISRGMSESLNEELKKFHNNIFFMGKRQLRWLEEKIMMM